MTIKHLAYQYPDMRLPKGWQNNPTCVKVKCLKEQNDALKQYVETVIDDIHNKGHYHNDVVLVRLVEDARYLLMMTEEM